MTGTKTIPFATSGTDPSGAGKETGLRQLSFAALGTKCQIQYATTDADQALGFECEAVAWVQAFEAKYSRFRADSLVGRINAAAGLRWVEFDEDMEGMLKLCDMLYCITRGILDPTLLPMLRLWDYKAVHPVVPSPTQIAAARQMVGWNKIERRPGQIFLPRAGMALDFGGFGKEYAVDIVAQLARNHGIADVLVDFGHDLRALGRPPKRSCWHVGLENPESPGTPAGSIGISGKGVASSGDYLRCFTIDGRRYGHIIDPRTGWPVANGCTQVTVVADTCLHAGVLSTTAFILGLKEGIEFIQGFPGAEGLIISGGARAQTRGFYQYEVAA